MNLNDTDFELFGVPATFAQDRGGLDARWKELQREAHPDRFAAQGPAAQRVAMQWSVRINEAYQRLKDPVRRAAYLCELHGAEVDAEMERTRELKAGMPAEEEMQLPPRDTKASDKKAAKEAEVVAEARSIREREGSVAGADADGTSGSRAGRDESRGTQNR